MAICHNLQVADLGFCDRKIPISGVWHQPPRWLVPNWCLAGLCRLAGQVVWGRGGRCVVGGLLGFVLRGGAWTVLGRCVGGVWGCWGASGVRRVPIGEVLSAARARRGARCSRLLRAG